MNENVKEENEGYLPAIRDLFLRAKDSLKGRGDVDKVRYGLKVLKRKLLGFGGREKTKSIDDIAGALTEIGIVSSPDEGKRVVPLLEKVALFYGEYKCMVMQKIDDKKYRIASYIGNRTDSDLLVKQMEILRTGQRRIYESDL